MFCPVSLVMRRKPPKNSKPNDAPSSAGILTDRNFAGAAVSGSIT
ncbi:MAG TPA: hypothetical protein VGV38_01815 [Pyrinomonadaceae bacterium]|nr:hypothetical protein [Pyrinomonadaceae bacterium]